MSPIIRFLNEIHYCNEVIQLCAKSAKSTAKRLRQCHECACEYHTPESSSLRTVNNFHFDIRFVNKTLVSAEKIQFFSFQLQIIAEIHVLLVFQSIFWFTATMEHDPVLLTELNLFEGMALVGWSRIQTEERRTQLANAFSNYILGKIVKLGDDGSFGVFSDLSGSSSSINSGNAIGVPGGSGLPGVEQPPSAGDATSTTLIKAVICRMRDLRDAHKRQLLDHAMMHWPKLRKKYELTAAEEIQVRVNNWMDKCTAHKNIQSSFNPQDLENLPESSFVRTTNQ